jgi:hypothetical protein
MDGTKYQDIPREIRTQILMEDINNYNNLIDADQDLRLFFDSHNNFKWLVNTTKRRISQFGSFYPDKNQNYWIDKVGSTETYNTFVRGILNNVEDCYRIEREFNKTIVRDPDGVHILFMKNGPSVLHFISPCNGQYNERDVFRGVRIMINYHNDIVDGDMLVYKDEEVIVRGRYVNGRLTSYNRVNRTGYLGITKLLDGIIEIPFIDYNLIETYNDGELHDITYEDVDDEDDGDY